MNEDLQARWAPTLNRFGVTQQQQHAETEEWFFSDANDFREDAVTAATNDAGDDGVHTGVMVAFYPDPAQARTLAVEGGEEPEDLHVTLVFLGEVGAELSEADEPALIGAVAGWAAAQAPIKAATNGHGIFATPSPVTYANVDAPDLPAARQSLVEALAGAGLSTDGTHMPLAYDELRDIQVPQVDMLFDVVVIAFAGTHTAIALKRPGDSEDDPGAPIQAAREYVVLTERIPGPAPLQPAPEATAFVTDLGGKTLITAPATTIAAMKDPTLDDITAEHMLWMHGRFVGADAPNRNGAFWSAGDLQMAHGTVTHGPLNWLHDARHVIGTLAKADYVDPGAGTQKAAASALPHITATAAIWRWIYPDEAYVVQQASEQEMLWYSMECISREVSCVGERGCGNTVTYAQYMAGAACDHIRQRASVRRFKDPIFLGGAVIVPPTRPGWADADARVMTTASSLAEAAYEQAGQPDVSTSRWEELMAQVVKFAEK
jgi:hypothetical protein